MSNFVKHGTLTTDTPTDSSSVAGLVTCAAELDSGSGTLTWQFYGPDGVWRTVYDGLTSRVYTGTHMFTVWFGDKVAIRAVGSASSSPVWDWQIMSNPANVGS